MHSNLLYILYKLYILYMRLSLFLREVFFF